MFELASPKSFDITYTDGKVMVGTVTKMPNFAQESWFQEGSIALWASSVTNLFRYIDKHMDAPRWKKSSSAKASDRAPGFYAFETYEEAMDVFKNRPNTIRIFDPKDDMIKIANQLGSDVFFAETGDFIDLGRVLDNDPEPFGNMFLGNPRSVFASVLINLGATYTFDEKLMRLRSQRLIRLVDWLESQQIRTKIVAFNVNECMHTEITVKRYEDSLNLNDIAIVSHPDFLRRVLYRIAEYSPTWLPTYGCATLANENRMKLPTSRDSSVLVLSEVAASEERITNNFETAEATIEANLTNDVTVFSLLT